MQSVYSRATADCASGLLVHHWSNNWLILTAYQTVWVIWENYVHSTFVFTFFMQLFLKSFYTHQPLGIIGRVFPNGPGDRGLIPGLIIPKTQKMILDTSLLNTQHNKIPPPLHHAIVANKKGALVSYTSTVTNFIYTFYISSIQI